ncbi:MAG: hypothetical protein Q9200_001722 [Gallowayella weberi]
MTSINTEALQELVSFAREHSPFYRKHYAGVPEHVSELSQLPVLDLRSFYAASTGLPPENKVLTRPLRDGAVFRTGGTTAVPKVSFVSREDLQQEGQDWVAMLVRAGLQAGDCVANLLHGGDLYKGFLSFGLGLTEGPTPNFQLPIGFAPVESQVWTLQTYKATIVAGMPTVMCRIADYLVESRQQVPSVRLLLYIGEMLHKDQRILLSLAFPSAQMGPMQYGSVDVGFVGRPDNPPGGIDQDPTPYTVNSPNMIMELITDRGEMITKEGIRGDVVVTNLDRRLMPIIRYPTGDVAEWVDYSKLKFHVCGRAPVVVRLGSASYEMERLKDIVSTTLKNERVNSFQVVLRRANGLDEMIFRIACRPQNAVQSAQKIRDKMNSAHTEFAKEVAEHSISPLVVEWISVQDLHYNTRSGKLHEVVDLRAV